MLTGKNMRKLLIHTDSPRTSLSVQEIKQSFLDNLFCGMGRLPEVATRNDFYTALAMTIRDRVIHSGVETMENYTTHDSRLVSYFSAEYLPGPHLANNLMNLGIFENTRQAMSELDLNLDELIDQEEEPGLGNGGLGRLASCYMDSLASLEVPAIGYGIRYEFGIFDQIIRNGQQVEITDKWLHHGNPWEIGRYEVVYSVKFGGHTERWTDEHGNYRVRWIPGEVVRGVAYDTPILGYRVKTCNFLRLWKAEAVDSFDFEAFNHGDYYRAVEDKVHSENLTKVLYPNDEVIQGKTLRLQQQFFFVSCSLQDMIRLHLKFGDILDNFHERWAIQLNDTHPSIAVAELMRLFVDEHRMDWDSAWAVTQKTFAFTNHTLLPEALEKWPLELFRNLLPRHMEIIYEINSRFLDSLRRNHTVDDPTIGRLSLIDESGERYIRMANLAALGSHHINGVARLHSELLTRTVMSDFARLWPEKFCNVTNGITPRRFIALSNPPLAGLINSRIGDGWLKDLTQLRNLESFAGDKVFQEEWRSAKHIAKSHLSDLILKRAKTRVDPDSLFDVQAKRLHEYKRQHLNVLHILTLYLTLKNDPDADIPPRTFIFGGKAAPGYFLAKLIIRLINAVARIVNTDSAINDHLKVAFFPDFNVKNAQHIYPAADLSEQISTAGYEASGTGNMKFSLNGALTIGTLDGANVEIREEVGAENFFLFGLTAEEVQARKAEGYSPYDIYQKNDMLRETIDFISSPSLSQGDRELFRPIVYNLLRFDPYMVLADYEDYIRVQGEVGKLWKDQSLWTGKSVLNAARMGKFSSDRSITDYCREIWNITPGSVTK
jgi:starch phosphorylase